MPPPQVDRRERIRREGTVAVRAADDAEDLPTRLEVTVATSDPVRVWGFDEVLSMAKSAVNLARLRNRAPFLLDHANRVESIVGVIENPRINGDRLVADVRLAETRQAQDYAALVKQGMAGKVSVGFSVERWKLTRPADKDKGVVAEYTATRWAPHEVSAVAVPADDRAAVEGYRIERTMEDPMPQPIDENNATARAAQPPAAQIDRESVIAEERQRVKEIEEYGAQFDDVGGVDKAREIAANGGTLDDLKAAIWEDREAAYNERAAANKLAGFVSGATGDGDPGLSARDIEGFSFVRAFDAMVRIKEGEVGYNCHEIDVMRAANKAIAASNARTLMGEFTIPASIVNARRERDLEAGSGAGSNLVATNLLADSFIDYLRASSVVLPRATVLTDLVGDYDIPRQSGTVNATWRTEGGNASGAADQNFDQVELRAKEMIIATTVTRKFLRQPTPDGEGLIRRDMGEVGGLSVDAVALLGSGSGGQPSGVYVLITPDTATSFGAGAANQADWGLWVGLETAIDENNALMGDLAYITNPHVRGDGKTTIRGGDGSGRFCVENNMANDHPVVATTQIPKTFSSADDSTGGNRSCLFFGNWRDVIVAYWTGLDILVNPYTGQLENKVTISAHQMADVQLRHVESFAAAWDIE